MYIGNTPSSDTSQYNFISNGSFIKLMGSDIQSLCHFDDGLSYNDGEFFDFESSSCIIYVVIEN